MVLIKRISSRTELEIAMQFISDGFKFNKLKANRFIKYLLISNKQIGYYGFISYDSDNIINGAILTPFQGKIEDENIVNISTWYMREDSRGLIAVKFAKYIVGNIDKHIMTIYSPNKSVKRIFKSLGFSSMDTIKVITSVVTCFSHKETYNYTLTTLSQQEAKEKFKYVAMCPNLEDTKFTHIKLQYTDIYIAGVRKLIKNKRILGFSFSIPIYRITWVSDRDVLASNWRTICFELAREAKTLLVELDLKAKDYRQPQYFFISRFLEKSSTLDYVMKNNGAYNYIPPLGSELSIDLLI